MNILKSIFLSLITALLLGMVTLFWSMVADINDLKAKDIIIDSEVKRNRMGLDEIGKMVKEIHWFLIKKK